MLRKCKILDCFPPCILSDVMPKYELVEKDGSSTSVEVEDYKHPYPEISYLEYSANSVIKSGGALSPAPSVSGSNMELADSVSDTINSVAMDNEQRVIKVKNERALKQITDMFNK